MPSKNRKTKILDRITNDEAMGLECPEQKFERATSRAPATRSV